MNDPVLFQHHFISHPTELAELEMVCDWFNIFIFYRSTLLIYSINYKSVLQFIFSSIFLLHFIGFFTKQANPQLGHAIRNNQQERIAVTLSELRQQHNDQSESTRKQIVCM